MRHGARSLALAATCVLACQQAPALLWPASASAAQSARAARIAPAGPVGTRAPSRAPLLSGVAPPGAASASEEEDQGAGVEGESDPLVSNGLGSPTCRGALAGELSAISRSHCETSGFLAAPAPTGDYGIDVHIDTSLLGVSLQGTVQNLLVCPLWSMLVWLVHALLVMLEWCFTIDLLDSPAAGGLANGLRHAQASFTEPWLALALALAAVLAAYQGLVRRRVADTLGELLVMAAMIVAGLWVMADPTGSVGALGQWANQASMGTMAVAAAGTPSSPGRTLGDSLDTVFAATIEGPWCYMEFGSVGWCRESSRLQRSLRSAGLAISAQELARAGCSSSSACVAAGSSAQALQRSAELLRQARSNGAIFLALPANGPARNSISEAGSLLRAICQNEEVTSCHGSAAAQAEFRIGGDTWERVSGLLLIAVGLLGMMLLFGFLALRLLVAAVFSLLYLMLTPVVVLAPAFGESGRAVFRKWGEHLLGAVMSKLLFSFLLGVVFAVLSILSDLTAIGWWTQWLLMSAFWWGAFMRRHQALEVVGGATGRNQAPRHSVMQIARQALVKRGVNDAYDKVKEKLEGAPPRVSGNDNAQREPVKRKPLESQVESQAAKSLRNEHRHAGGRSKHDATHRLSELRRRLPRVRAERDKALAAGDRRRAARLGQRGARIAEELAGEQTALAAAKRIAGSDSRSFVRENRDERERFLDAQAALPNARAKLPHGAERRDYPRLAGLVGYAQRSTCASGRAHSAPRAWRSIASWRCATNWGSASAPEPDTSKRRAPQRRHSPSASAPGRQIALRAIESTRI